MWSLDDRYRALSLANNTQFYENFCFSLAVLMFIQVREELAMTDIGGKWLNLSKRENCIHTSATYALSRRLLDFWKQTTVNTYIVTFAITKNRGRG